MRFTLRALLISGGCVAVVISMLTMYGVHGILFAAINCSVAVGCLTLFSRRRALSAVCGLLYVALWCSTVVGSASVRNDAISRLQKSLLPTAVPERNVAQFDIDPVALNTQEQVQWPWFHVGAASVPCPFVIVLDHATMTETFGYSGRAHLLWIFGYTWNFAERPNWIRC
ncbi:hypothetical protein Rcae01_00018 [Novipirellula caenicola]|uniref:Uncharacterized protein n=1 Tax=Novipirellula caenicola TaxID=1536901 RepID=A0ABP9VH94_9BACT